MERDGKCRAALPAFTLLELLIVITIISVLAALLLPAFSKAKQRAIQINCLTNLKQLGIAAQTYTSDHQHLPPMAHNGTWVDVLRRHYGRSDGILLCGATSISSPGFQTLTNPFGTADAPWYRSNSIAMAAISGVTEYVGSYTMNTWVTYFDIRRSWVFDPPFQGTTNDPKTYLFRFQHNISKPELTPWFADSITASTLVCENDAPAQNLYTGRRFTNNWLSIGNVTISRHGGRPASAALRDIGTGPQTLPGGINMVFTDGRAEYVPLENLWLYYWHKRWDPTLVTLPHPNPAP